MTTKIIVAGKKIKYEQLSPSETTIERLYQHLINGALTARMAGTTDLTPSQPKSVKDIIVKSAFKR